MKLIILIISCKDEIYSKLEKTISETWASKKHDNTEIYFLHCDENINEVTTSENLILTKCSESWGNILNKTIQSFDFLYETTDFDYVFRTNLSSYIDVNRLRTFLSENNIDYGGVIGNKDGINLASGAGIILSRKIIKKILEHKDELDHNEVDDVAIARLLSSKNIFPRSIDRKDILSYHDSDNYEMNYFHYRCKQHDRNQDSKILSLLHKQKNNEENSNK